MERKVDRKLAMRYPRYALISVADKTGIENLARALCDFGFEVLSTGGTAKALASSGIPLTEMSEYTGFPEILDGRVKSLHPRVYGGILARDIQRHFDELLEISACYVDIVICNLHSFHHLSAVPSTPLHQLVDSIDVGGPTLLKAAAKNFERVATICDADKYEDLLWYLASKGEVPYEIRFEWAKRAFEHVTTYDSMVYATLMEYDLATGQRILGDSCGY
jgi:phosphoribosylaminoimidazolecarboxamide formyltransferase/IMP cyclohydrolase